MRKDQDHFNQVLKDKVEREEADDNIATLARLFDRVKSKDKIRRDKVIAAAYLSHGYYMKEIAAFLGIHYRTVSYAVARHEDKMS